MKALAFTKGKKPGGKLSLIDLLPEDRLKWEVWIKQKIQLISHKDQKESKIPERIPSDENTDVALDQTSPENTL